MQRGDLQSVPSMATRVGLMLCTRSSGTVPPDEAHSPQKKDTRKYEQQAPQFRHGLASDMGVFKGKGKGKGGRQAAILGFPTAMGRGGARYFFSLGQTLEKTGKRPGNGGCGGFADAGGGALGPGPDAWLRWVHIRLANDHRQLPRA